MHAMAVLRSSGCESALASMRCGLRERPQASEQIRPLIPLSHPGVPKHCRPDLGAAGYGFGELPDTVEPEVVLEVAADAGQMLAQGEPDAMQLGFVTNTGLHQHLRGVNGSH
jgi:hypothetical protein